MGFGGIVNIKEIDILPDLASLSRRVILNTYIKSP